MFHMGSFLASAVRSLRLGGGGICGGPGVRRPRDRRTLKSLTKKIYKKSEKNVANFNFKTFQEYFSTL